MNSSEFFKALFARHDLVGGVFVGNVQVLQHVAPELLEDLHYDESNHDVYFHVTAHDPERLGSRGTIASSTEVTALWCDLDLNISDGKSDDYADKEIALELIKRTGPDIIVSTGGGYHTYWLLDAPVQSKDYKTLVKDWQAYCTKLLSDIAGRHVKLDQTGDLARVLRVPGTLNTKHDHVVTAAWNPTIGETVGKPVTYFTGILKESGMRTANLSTTRTTNTALSSQLAANLGAIDVAQDPVKLGDVSSRCAQVRQVLELRGNVYEPLWYTALGVAAFVQEPEQAAHALSSGHPEYQPEETIKKMNQWRDATDGPPTCGKFMQDNPQGCVGCPFNKFEKGVGVNSPLQLGRMGPAVEETTPEPIATEAAAAIGTAQLDNPEPQVEELGGDPVSTGHFMAGKSLEEGVKLAKQFVVAPYHLSASGAVVLTTLDDDNQEMSSVIMPNGPIPIRYQQHIEGEGASNHYAFATWDKWAGQWRIVSVPGAVFSSAAKLAEHIAPHTQHLSTPARVHAYMNTAALQIASMQKPEQLVSAYGWVPRQDNKPARFALGNTMYYPNGDKSTTSLIDETSARDFGLNPMGELGQWRLAVSMLLSRPELEWHRFAFLAALGAPLLKFSPVAGGMVSLYSGQSGTYKSFTTRLINSIYSRGDQVTIVKKNSTAHAQNAVLSNFNGVPTTFDEISEITPDEIRTLAYSISDGQLRQRLTKSGMRQSAREWSTIMVCTTNRMLFDKIAEDRFEAGAEAARLIELDVSKASGTIPIEEVQQINDVLDKNSGLAGPLMAEYITRHQDKLNKIYNEIYLKKMQELGGSSDWRFWVSLTTCATLAASIGRSLGILSEDVTSGIEDTCKKAILAQVGQHEQAKIGIAEMVNDFLAENIGKAVVVNTQRHPVNRNQPREIWYSTPSVIEGGKAQVVIWQTQLIKFVASRGFNKAALSKELKAAGMLDDSPKHWNYPQNLYLKGTGGGVDWPAPTRPKCVTLTIDASAMPDIAITNEETANET